MCPPLPIPHLNPSPLPPLPSLLFPLLPLQKRSHDLQKRVRKDGKVMSLAQTKRTNELEKDMNAWEENRLITSGVVTRKEVGGGGWRGRRGGGGEVGREGVG